MNDTTSKADALATSEKPDLTPPVLPTELIGPKGWLRTILCLELAKHLEKNAITKMIKESWTAFKARVPLAGVEAIPVEGKQAGLYQYRVYGEDEIDDFEVKHLEEEMPTYAELKALDFPLYALRADKVCFRGYGGEWPSRNDKHINTVFLRLNFVKGGVLLNLLMFHGHVDGTAMYKFTELFAEDIRRHQGIPITKPADVHVADRAKLLELPSGTMPGNPEDHPEYVELPLAPEEPPELLRQNFSTAALFHFTPESIQELKQLAHPANAQLFRDDADLPPFISTNDVITAVIWRSVIQAHFPSDAPQDCGSRASFMALAVDLRRRNAAPLHPHTLGNIFGIAHCALPLSAVRSADHASLADLAIVSRRAISVTNTRYVDSLHARIARLSDVLRLCHTVYQDIPGASMTITSWREFPYYDIEWGPVFAAGKIDALRFPDVGVTHAFNAILPDHPARPGVEVMVCVNKECAERLKRETLLSRFATPVGGGH